MIGVAGEGTARPPPLQPDIPERPERGARRRRSRELAHRLAPPIVPAPAEDQLGALRRETRGAQALDGTACRRFARICPAERGHLRPPSWPIVPRYRSTI